MRHPAVPPFLALLAGAVAALYLPLGAAPWLAAGAVACWQIAIVAFIASRLLLSVAAALAAIALSASASALHVDWQRRHAPIRALVPVSAARPSDAEPVVLEGVLTDDASLDEEGASLRLRVERVRWNGVAVALPGTVLLSVAGQPDAGRVRAWTRGRRIRAPALLRRAAHYRNDGVADAELALARRGVALVGSIKSAALVEVTATAPGWEEHMARVRAFVRRTVAGALPADREAAAVVTAILIGDRAGLPPETERRMQRAGTYHVIAISGGNIALFAMLAWGVARALVRSGRGATLVAMAFVASYGLLVGTGASVGRAVLAALVFLLARLFDHRAPPINAIALVGIVFLAWDPLATVDVGFLLSFGATAGILLAAPPGIAALAALLGGRAASRPALVALWLVSLVIATIAAEIALLPIQASAFHRVTLAGLALNLVAIPAMAVVQVAGMAAVAASLAGIDMLLPPAAWAARCGARALVDSAALVDVMPALTWRVAAPPVWLAACYGAACALIAWRRWPRLQRGFGSVALVCGAAIASSGAERAPPDRR
ncbi:MAG: ComEC family competence protein, partial [Acidobacteriota bacterium]|nr:ComEC family competence protein [Acidobacteriota bacterium]